MYMNKKQREKRTHVTLTLPISTKFKARQMADTMGITISHLIEGLLEGAVIASGGIRETN